MRRPAYTFRLLTDAIFAMNHRWLFRVQCQRKRKTFVNSLQNLAVALPSYAPIPIPDASLLVVNPRNPWPCAVCPFRVIKGFAVQVAKRQMRQIQIVNVPSTLFPAFTAHAFAEKRQFKAETMPIVRGHVPRVVPPFRLIFRMIEIIARKFITVTRHRNLVGLLSSQTARPNHQQDPRASATPHGRPQADSISPPPLPDTVLPAPWLRTRRSAPHTTPRSANETGSSIRTIACL